MEAEFWHRKWNLGDIGFHISQVNPLLVAQLGSLNLCSRSRIFLPLCGKTHDIGWLLEQDFRVTGIELSSLAVSELFEELGITPNIATIGSLLSYSADNIEIFVGDIFNLSAELLGPVDAVYDRAALVAFNSDMRRAYAIHVTHITNAAPQLLIAYEYDQSRMKGPPFSVDAVEINQMYGAVYSLSSLVRERVEGGLKGLEDAMETAWFLQKPE